MVKLKFDVCGSEKKIVKKLIYTNRNDADYYVSLLV